MSLPDPKQVRGEPCPQGWHYEWVVDEDFEVADGAGWRCRWTDAGARCTNEPSVILWRPTWKDTRPKRPWRYCTDHMYGRFIHDGEVWDIHTVRDQP